jgi:hypothetical protein
VRRLLDERGYDLWPRHVDRVTAPLLDLIDAGALGMKR